MRFPTWLNRLLIVVAAAALLAVVAILVVHFRRSNVTHKGLQDVSIPAGGGVKLSAEVLTPAGSGPFPLLVMPASWGQGVAEYRLLGIELTQAGFEVLSYAQRGFQGSGGEVDLAGRQTQQDVSTVIDWALKHTLADSTRIGLFGVSYGGGVGLLAAAHDSRIKAVVATSSWTDLADALVPNGATNLQGLGLLFGKPQVDDALDAQVRKVADDVTAHPPRGTAAGAQLRTLSAERSADRVVAGLNRNHPAIMIANAYQDSLLDPSSLVSFYDRLTTPKRLQLATGDHGGPEWDGILGRSDPTVQAAAKWLDHYLNGTANGVRSNVVVLQDSSTGAVHTFTSWPAADDTLHLGTPSTPHSITTASAAVWSHALSTGADSGADVPKVQGLYGGAQYQHTTVASDSIQGGHAYVWSGAPTAQPMQVNGMPTLSVQVSSAAPSVTLFAYLYDVNGGGTATLMTYAPATVSSGAASITLRPVSWTVPAGHHLMLIVDTADPAFASAEPAGTTVTLSAPAALSLSTR